MSIERHAHGLHIVDVFENYARKGDGQFAIAFALLKMTEAQERGARAIDDLALNSLDPEGCPGAVEKLAMELGRLAAAVEQRAHDDC